MEKCEKVYVLLELMYIINDTDYYMKALTLGGDILKVKLTKSSWENWEAAISQYK